MHTAAIRKMELIHKISKLPEKKIPDVEKYIQKIISQIDSESTKPINLKGLWKNKGFEKLGDLEKEINTVKNEMNNSILKKAF